MTVGQQNTLCINTNREPLIISSSMENNTAVLTNSIINHETIKREIVRGVMRQKLNKMRHLVIKKAISTEFLDGIFPTIKKQFEPQVVSYSYTTNKNNNFNSSNENNNNKSSGAGGKEWKISCYLEVMEGGVPCTNPSLKLKNTCDELLESCNHLFEFWYKQQHPSVSLTRVERIMTFITRYTPNPGEEALLKHVDGAGKVDGSLVLALPMESPNLKFEGGGLTFWDGCDKTRDIDYQTRSGDVAFIDRAVWHQANPITKGTRWAMVIFYKVYISS